MGHTVEPLYCGYCVMWMAMVATIGRHIFEDKIFEDFVDIYPALKIFILKNIYKYQNHPGKNGTLEVF